MLKVTNALLAIVGGVSGSLLLFYVMNFVCERLPEKWEARLKPYVFVGPAIAAITLFLIYPAILTIQASFANADTTAYVGLDNYTSLLSSSDFQSTLINTLLWITLVPAITVALGLTVATLADRLTPQMEKLTKSIIFLPMAISMVGASAIWGFIYAFRPAGSGQIGLLNQIVTMFGGDPQTWLQFSQLKMNSLLLMVVLIWLQVGYSMVLLSAAIKGVPDDTVEAGRIDGAGEARIFFSIVVPQIWATVITVFITVLILVMKTFDIVYVMTNGSYDTNIIGVAFFNELFTNLNNGRAGAIVVMLMVAIVPVMAYQVRQFRLQEAER